MPRTRRRLLEDSLALAVTTGALGPAAALAAPTKKKPAKKNPYAKQAKQVRDVYREAWRTYCQFAFGADQLRPVSGKPTTFYLNDRSTGLTIFEAIDTLWLMGLDTQVEVARKWIAEEFSPAIPGQISVFETTIRLMGGLLAGYHVTRDPKLLGRAVELGDRLLPAFNSPTGIPYQRVDLATGAVWGPGTAIGEVNHLAEFAELSRLTRRPQYYAAAKKAAAAVVARRSKLGLLPTSIHVETGAVLNPEASMDPPVESFMEALWDGWRLTRDPDLLSWFRTLQSGVLSHLLVQRPSGRWWFKHAEYTSGNEIGSGALELSAYYPGLLAESGERVHARRVLASWTALLDRYPILPLGLDTVSGAVTNPANELYPEYVDACFTAWLWTGDERYRRLAARYWDRERRTCRVPGRGLTIAGDVTRAPVVLGDLTPGYWFSETPKYLWLLFSGTERFDYRRGKALLTTEGKLLRGRRRVR